MSKPSKSKIPADKPQDTKGFNRRSFFVMGGSAIAAAATAVPLATEAEADESQAERVKARYKADSPDVKNYYRVNRY